MNDNTRVTKLDEAGIMAVLRVGGETGPGGIPGILAKARALKGRNGAKAAQVAVMANEEPLAALFWTPTWLKNEIRRGAVLFAPLFHSNTRRNECLFRAFRSSNKKAARVRSIKEIALELGDMSPNARRVSERMLEHVKSGRRDVFC